MATFIWSLHQQETEYPESGFRMQLGNSYMATAAPVAPDQRTFTLSFGSMCYFTNQGDTWADIDAFQQPELNFALLEAFYVKHKLHKSFDYMHPVYGKVICKFNKPLKVPKGIPSGNGWLQPFTLELIECPYESSQGPT